MATLSISQIRDTASKAGFQGKDLDVATAVALAESGGNTNAHNSKPPDNSYGLWQINMLGDLGPSRRKQFGIATNDQLFDPNVNAKAAYAIYKGSGWKAWTTYTSGKYKGFMPAETGEYGLVKNDGSFNVDNPAAAIPNAINAFGSTMFKSLTNLTGIGIALVFLILGAVFLIMSSSNAKKAARMALDVIPGGGVAKKVAGKAVGK